MIDIIMPRIGTEEKFIQEAQKLGFSKLILLYELVDAKKILSKQAEKLKKSEIEVKLAVISEKKVNLKDFDFTVGLGTKINNIFGGLTHLLNNENEDEKDFIHQRRSGLNHVLLAELAKKEIAVLSGLDQLRKKSVSEQAIILGRMIQNKKLCIKKKIPYHIVSLAKELHEMKSAKDLNIFSQNIN